MLFGYFHRRTYLGLGVFSGLKVRILSDRAFLMAESLIE
jgi:hypothetical protein